MVYIKIERLQHMNNFIQRTYIDNKTNEQLDFKGILSHHNMSIILGEPSSGKTYQLEEYNRVNPKNSIFVELMFLDETINVDTEVVLLDSIDEALSKNDSDKILKRKLTKYILECRAINPNVKFVITCRYVEWKESFEEALRLIDKELKIFYIEDLTTDNINRLLKQRNIDEIEFWDFIEKNYLDNLLKNIMMVLHLINNFNEYKGKQLKYSKIYQEIIEIHILAETENERKEQLAKLPLLEMLKISSSVAIYMTLNRTRTISIEEINKLANELYILDGINITGEKLNIVFDTALFSGNRDNIRFFHKSIQEYLTAYFINTKQLNIATIKSIFAYDYGFYEEFEEVIIYLTNIEEQFFKHFIEFDPLIFRRHPHLSKEEQSFLLVAMLILLQQDRQRAWSKWEYIEDSSLTRFDLVENIVSIIKENIDIKNINRELFVYLKSLLVNNYSVELEDVLFEVLENIKSNKRLCITYMDIHRIDNLNYNKRLFDFIIKNDLIDYEENYLYFDVFDTLYDEVEFKDLVVLIKHFSLYDKYKLLEIKIDDILFWLKDIIENHNKRNKEYSDEQISFLIFLVLRDYKNLENKNILNTIVKFIEDNYIHIRFDISDYDKGNYTLDFNDIKDDFLECFFTQSLDNRHLGNILDLTTFYNLQVKDIEEMSIKYKIEDYKEHYLYFRNKIENVFDFLMKNLEFKAYMEDIWARHKEQEKEWEDRDWEKEQKKKKKKKLKIYTEAISSLKTKEDLLNIYLIAKQRNDRENKTYDKITKDLGNKYKIFLDLIKEEFRKDTLYIKIETKIQEHSIFYFTMLFDYLFLYISNDEIDELISSDEEYKKLFWHTLSSRHLSKDFFLYISNKNINNLILIVIKIFETSLINSEYKKSLLDYQVIDLFKKLKIFDKDTLEDLIKSIKDNMSLHYATLEEEDKNYLIEILSIDDSNYDFIKEILLKDNDNFTIYFKALFVIDINRAINDYIDNFYPKNHNRIVFKTVGSVDIMKQIFHNKFDVLDINPKHRQCFQSLMNMLYSQYHDRGISYSKLNDDNLKFILEQYFDFFKEYYHPKGTFSPGVYDNMNDIINSIFNTFDASEYKINLLEELKDNPNTRLQTRIKRQLEISYNLKLKNRKFNNEYYKDIVDNFVTDESCRFFDFTKLKIDLIDIALLETENRKDLFTKSEDEINDRFRTDLILKDYFIADQSRGGESESKKNVGERDLVVRNKESGIAECIIEAFILKADTSSTIETHYNKLIANYDTLGSSNNFILIYSKVFNYQDLWIKYQQHFPNFTIEENSQEYVKIGYSIEDNMKITHLFINFYSE